jgi:very-short-patch-repair endonuclease
VEQCATDGPPDDGQLTRRDAGPKDIYKKRYNVAASRARDQLWVIYSMDPDAHLKSGDRRRRLIDHARDPEALLRAIEKEGSRVASPFEKMVLHGLVDAGYRVQPQWSVGSYRIDLVVQGESRKLAVECDGERWHTPEQLQSDLERQAIIERLGWVFVRIRGSVFFRDPDFAMIPVFNKLRELEIEPLGMDDLQGAPAETARVIERVRRRAQVLRAEWSAEGTAGDISTKEAT